MKKITEIIVNGWSEDAVIEYYMNPDKNGLNIIWADQKSNIAKCHGNARSVTIYARESEIGIKYSAFNIPAGYIKRLYEEIISIERITSEEFID